MRQITTMVGVLLYEMELFPDGGFVCYEFIGLESVLGDVPTNVDPEEAYETAVHPDDRELYDASFPALQRCEPVEIEYRLIGYDGQTRWVLDRMRPRETSEGRLLVDGVVTDITRSKHATEELAQAQRLAHYAVHDSLTELPNRIAFQSHMTPALARAERNSAAVAVLFVDLDNFKMVNDNLGHAAGDNLLREVAARLRNSTRASDVVARQSGDEFLILLADLPWGDASAEKSALSAVETVATNVRDALRAPFHLAGVELVVSASIGISLFPRDAREAESLLCHADIAMYGAKDAGRDDHMFYNARMSPPLGDLSAATRLRKALENDEGVVLHYQPVINLETTEIVGAEALVRWDDSERGLVYPAEFLPVAERSGLMRPLTDRVLDQACTQASLWEARGQNLFVSANVPASYLGSGGLERVLAIVERLGLGLDTLVIEITESEVGAGGRMVDADLKSFRDRGLRIAIDDFGTGHSALSRLNEGWVDMVKIDRSFVQAAATSTRARQLVSSIIQLADTLGFETVAEGVETEDQRRFLVEHGCRFGQGYYFGKAIPPEKFERCFLRLAA